METFKTWISKVVIKGMPKKQQKKVMNAIDINEESDNMVNNIEVAMREFKIRSIREGKAEGRAEGRLEGKTEAILELLEDLGAVPQELEITIKKQRDFDVLTKWHKISAKAESIDAFREKAGI